ncbi:hypothetical protein [Brazilian marseillevirus]|uniref:hypothetical protein n=1 Tax=Brazilian marseillevirus TaxID=1813599 RepID=UPI0007842D84|nr:hypothetical protein A3303_gp479 [Brazilian marseillevirus]AMQ10987.1 hypothetical protein [Brazilian marseillevirus]
MSSLVNPETGRNILYGGKTHMMLLKRGILPREEPFHLTKKRTLPGASNVKKYRKEHLKTSEFCGTVPGSFPVNTERRARAAIAYARNDMNPERVKKCAYSKAKREDWF